MVEKNFTKVMSRIYLALVLLFLYAPILCIIVFSFFNTDLFTFEKGFSFEAYTSIFTSSKSIELWNAIGNTVFIAVIAATVSTLLGTFSAIGIFNLSKRTRRAVENINQLPIINSEIVMAVSFMVFFSTFAFPEGYLRLILAHIAFCTPYVVLNVMPQLTQMDPHIYEAALDLGANPNKALRKVMLPILKPGIISGFVLSFTLSMDDFIITQINKGNTGIETLSTFIYGDAHRKGMEPFWFAVFSMIFVLILTILLVVNLKKSTLKENKNEKI
mgnify:CR=1 FL=1